MSLEVGDWARSYSSGIWQVYRVLEYKCKNPATGSEQDKTTVFSKRFVSKSYKKSFKEECCSPSFVWPLRPDEKAELELFINENTKLYEKFIAFEPKNIDCIYNARIGIPESKDTDEVVKKFSNSKLVRDIDINSSLTDLGYDTEAMPYWTVQFVSDNFMLEDGCLMFEFSQVLE